MILECRLAYASLFQWCLLTVGTNALLASQKEYYSDLVGWLILDIRSLLLMSTNIEISTKYRTCKHPFEQQFHQDQ